MPVHMGRRLLYAASIGVASADGTYLAFALDKNLPRLLTWLDALKEPAHMTS